MNSSVEMSQAIAETMDEQRATSGRREFGWRTVFFGFLRSRRRFLRRNADANVIFMDWHHPWLFFLAVGTMLLSCIDAFRTLLLIDLGMIEANPFVASLLGQGTAVFAATKLAMTGLGILTLVFLAKSRFLDRVRTGLFLTTFFTVYACLVCYEIVNLLHLM
jgi:Domain of unknown function (DUF5658)